MPGDDDDTSPVSKAEFEEAVDKMVKMMGDIGKKLDTEVSSVRQECSLLSTSIKNVQTQLLDKQGRFDSHSSFPGDGTPAPPVHKLRFPKYDGGDDPLTWLHKGEQFFRAHGTPEDQKVWTATFYLQGAASQWYYRWEKNHGVPSWKDFVDGVNKRFGPPLRSNPLGELSQCRRTGSVDEYVDQFLKLLARCDDVSEKQQINLFTAGLLQPMSTDVEMHAPATLEDAMALARLYECRAQLTDDAT